MPVKHIGYEQKCSECDAILALKIEAQMCSDILSFNIVVYCTKCKALNVIEFPSKEIKEV